MKIKRQDLLTALKKVQPGLASAEVIEQSTSFVFRDGQVITYNDEIACAFPIDLDLEGAVQSKELLALLQKIKDEELNLSTDDGELIVKGKKVEAGIRLEEEINLPILTFEPKEGFYELPDKFLDGLKVCLFSAAQPSVSPILSNIHMKDTFIESCDNFRLTRFELGEDSEDEILVPALAARHLINTGVELYGEDGGWLFFKENESQLIFACRTYNDEYEDLGQFLKIKDPAELQLPVELREVLDRSGIFASADDRSYDLVVIEVKDNWIRVESENETGWIREKIRTKTKGADLTFQVNPSLLRDILKISTQAEMNERMVRFAAEDFVHVVTLVPAE